VICPHCHQNIGVERFGVRLSPLKARIVDMVKAAGDVGITAREIGDDIYRGMRERRPNTVGVHIFQINELLAATTWVIAADGRGPLARWFLRRRRITQRKEMQHVAKST
jgi:hypothetical protein